MSGCEWPWATLEEVATVTAGNPAPQGAEYFEGGSRPFVRVQDLGRLDGAAHLTETADLVNDRAAGTLKLFPRGSVLFTKSGASLLLNQRAILSRDMHVVSHIGVAVPGPHITSEWLYYWLCTIDFADIAHGANMPSLPLARVKQVRVPVPPVPEQRRRVAEIEKQFSRLDEANANLKRVKANLKRYKAAALKAALEGRLVPTEAHLARHESRSYETGTELLQWIVAQRQAGRGGALKRRPPAYPATAQLPSVPDGWVYCSVSQVCDVASGNTPAGVLAAVRPDGALPWFKVGDMNHADNQQVMHHADSWLSEADAKALGLRIFPSRTLLFPKRGGAIATNKKRVLDQPGCADLNVMGITPCEVIDEYFRVWFDSVDLGKLSDGSNVPQINHKDIDPLPLPLPPRAEQDRIVAEVDRRLSIVREVEAEVDSNLTRAETLRRQVLSKAFVAPRGEVDRLTNEGKRQHVSA